LNGLNKGSSLFLIGFSIVIFFTSRKLGLGDPQSPGPGFFPFLASLLVFSLSLLVLIKDLIGSPKDREKEAFIGWAKLKRPASLLVALSACALLLPVFGYLIISFLLVFSMFFICEPKKWYIHILTSVIIANLSFFVFYKVLGVRFPTGLFQIVW